MPAEIRHFDADMNGVQTAGIYIVIDDQPVIGPFRNVEEAQRCLHPASHTGRESTPGHSVMSGRLGIGRQSAARQRSKSASETSTRSASLARLSSKVRGFGR
jgi:hypothetical protein